MLEEASDDELLDNGGQRGGRGGADGEGARRAAAGSDVRNDRDILASGGHERRAGAASADGGGADGDGARADRVISATLGHEERAGAAGGGRGGAGGDGANADGVDDAHADGADGAHADGVHGANAAGVDGAHADGVSGRGAIDVGSIDVGVSGAGANGDSSGTRAVNGGRAGYGGERDDGGSGDTTRREHRARRERVSSEMFTREELKTFFVAELRVILGLAARQAGGAGAVRMQGRFINGAQVMVLTELMDPVAVWTTFVDGAVRAYCSCGGVMATGRTATADDIEPVDLQVALQESSSCRHAVALLDAYDCLCADVRAGSLEELKRSFPLLLGSSEGAPVDEDDTVVLFAMRSGKRNNIPVYAVFHLGIWSPAVVWQQGNRNRLTTCCLLSCKTQPWACIHAKAVNYKTRADRTSSSQAVADTLDAMHLGAGGILDDGEEEEAASEPSPPESAAAAAAAAALEANLRPRRARNMFPCVREVEMCDRYAAFVDEEREAPGQVNFTDFLHVEDECFSCDDRWTESTVCKPTLAKLFTIRGRLAIVTKSWTCARGHHVAYDGSVDGLFAFRPETVYTRVFLDSLIELCVIARSTLAAASEFLASFLRNTAAFAEGEPGQARQQLSDACGEFCDSLVVPKAAFVCHRCGEDEDVGGSFHCVVCDGQILSVLQEHVVAMLRPGMNAPRVDFAMTFACAVRHAAPRRVVRNRVRAKPTDTSALTKAEAEVWPAFAAVADWQPPAPPSLPRLGPPRTAREREAAALWAASVVVNTFFKVDVAQPAGAGDAVADVGVGEPGELLHEEDGDLVDLVADDLDGEEVEDGPVDGEGRGAGSVAGSTDGSGEDSDGNILSQVDGWLNAGRQAPPRSSGALANAPQSSQEELSAALRRVVLRLRRPVGESETRDQGATASQRRQAAQQDEQPTVAVPVVPQPSHVSSEPAIPIPAADPNRDQLAADQVPRTASPWFTPLSSTAAVAGREVLGEGLVALDRNDPASPLTTAALERTQAIADATNEEDSELMVTIDNVPLDVSNLQRTLPNRWFVDEVINGYINLLRRRQAETRRIELDAPRLWFFNTFFYSRMHVRGRYDYNLVARWCGRLNLLSFDMIFVPINVSSTHWVLAVMYPRTGMINTYDSLNINNDALVPSLKRWADDHARDVGNSPVEWGYDQVLSRQQENSDDCGVFLVTAMDYLARGLPLSARTASMHYYRRRICASLLAMQL